MLSLNQQGAPNANIGVSSGAAYTEQWTNVQHHWSDNSTNTNFNHQTESLSMQTTVEATNFQSQSFDWPNKVAYHHHQYQSPGNYFSSRAVPSQLQLNQIPVIHSPSLYPTSNRIQPQKYSTPGKSHQARISLVPNASGGFKAVVMRKRKRTMFTTEQVEALELVFQRKPYVTRDDRQVLVNQLRLSDTSIKVWFQNRRLRGKRAAEEAAEQALYEEHNSSEQSFYSGLDSNYQESSCSPSKMSRLDIIESELSQKVDESGYITLDEKSICDIVSVIDSVLSVDVNLILDVPSESTKNVDLISNPSNETVELNDSEESSHASSMYEPISPAASPVADSTDEQAPRWQPFAPEQSLQRLFDLHFC